MTLSHVFVDTSFWYASLDPRDENHEGAAILAEEAAKARARMHSTREVVGETLTLLRHRASARAALLFLDRIVPAVHVIDSAPETHATAAALFRRLAPRRRLSYCDALSFVVVRTVLHDVPCLAFDRDFRALGLTVMAR